MVLSYTLTYEIFKQFRIDPHSFVSSNQACQPTASHVAPANVRQLESARMIMHFGQTIAYAVRRDAFGPRPTSSSFSNTMWQAALVRQEALSGQNPKTKRQKRTPLPRLSVGLFWGGQLLNYTPTATKPGSTQRFNEPHFLLAVRRGFR